MALILAGASGATALAAGTNDAYQLFDAEAQVVTASRRPQALRDSPVAIDVITAEEIRASGAESLADIMRFRVGMDVVDSRTAIGSTALISVRGFPQEFAHNLQVLIDGRSVYSAINGGVSWEQLPVQIQDIERIEIVRGPNGALYGSNAGQGVINIITRQPRQNATSVRAQGRLGSQHTVESGLAFATGGDDYAYRLSQSYQDTDGLQPTQTSRDDASIHSNKANFRGAWKPRPGLTLDVQTGGSWDHLDIPDGQRGRFDQHFEMAQLASDAAEASSWELTAARNEINSAYVPGASGPDKIREYQYDFEGLQRLRWLNGRVQDTWGVSYRDTAGESDQFFRGAPVVQNHILREYLNQTTRLVDGLSLTAGISLEQSPLNGNQQSYQAALLASPFEHHSFRASYSRAVTDKPYFNAEANYLTTKAVLLQGNPGGVQVGDQSSYELSYMGSCMDQALSVETNVYYMQLDKMDFDYVKSVNPFPFLVTVSYDSSNNALARGLEAKLKYRLDAGRSLFANYTYEKVTDALGDVAVAKMTPQHKLNLGAMGALGRGFSAYAVAGYKDHYTAESASGIEPAPRNIPAYWRLDARLSYAATSNLELFVGGTNLAQSLHREFADTLEVPRSVYGGFTLSFGKKL